MSLADLLVTMYLYYYDKRVTNMQICNDKYVTTKLTIMRMLPHTNYYYLSVQ